MENPVHHGVAARGLTFRFPSSDEHYPVLNNIELELAPGEIAILTGPSGSGKTTLLTLIGALRSVQEGRLNLLGRELSGLPPRELVAVRRDIGFIFQSHNLLKSLTARQNVRLALEVTRKRDAGAARLARDILNRLGLGERMDYRPEDLSGGQQQRVAVARALVTDPKLVLADEPTAALDEENSRIVVDILKERAREQGVTVLIVTHDSRILDSADRIINMVDGRIASDINVEETIEICDFLKRCPVFEHMSADELTEISQKMVREEYPPGRDVVIVGEEGKRFYVIREGELAVERPGDDGMKIVSTLHPGNYFGEAALITGDPRNATVTTRTGAVVYSLDKKSFQEALDDSAPFNKQLRARFFHRGG